MEKKVLKAPSDGKKNILQWEEYSSLPGMLGTNDCSRRRCKNCFTAYDGLYKGKVEVSTITMEAVSKDRFYFWYIFFGMTACNNETAVFSAFTNVGNISAGQYP